MTVSPALPSAAASSDGQGRSERTILCFSHLRWDFVFQRPQHLMSRLAEDALVLFWEEPRHMGPGAIPRLDIRICGQSGVTVITPVLPSELRPDAERAALKRLLDGQMACARGPVQRWYYTPMMLPFSEHVASECVVYDCMDEFANFWNAPAELLSLEQRLFEQADVVFTGGHSLYEAKLGRHSNIHVFPSSIDVAHFARARGDGDEPGDQSAIARPRFGFFGVIDERMDLDLLAALADARPGWSVVMVGPVAKIDPATLPRRANLHYLGRRTYGELPEYLRGWDVALMPFALNDATRFISPTKTPEYLAGGRPVVSTPIADVVRQYGALPAVRIADTPTAFIAACDAALALSRDPTGWLSEVDRLLADTSWDRTFTQMQALVAQAIDDKRRVRPISPPRSVEPVHYDVMVVGAGFAGAVMAERLAAGSGKKVLVVDRRPHVGGNAFDHPDATGVLIHHYGPHIFHTNSREIVDYLSRFTDWRSYEHRVLAEVDGRRVPIPINRTTLNQLYGLDLRTDTEAAAFLAGRAEPVAEVRTSADVMVSAVGRDLYEKLFQGYSRKRWGVDPSELDKAVLALVPIRTGTDDRYFTDSFQAMPKDGYTRMFERMLDHPNIDLMLGVDFEEVRDVYPHDHLVFTGPIDGYFGHRYGKLPYRSLEFRHVTVDREWFQEAAVVKYPAETVPYTRITEYKYLTGQVAPRTSITYEYPSIEGDPAYPIPRPENEALFKRYEALATARADVTFVGWLTAYRYYDMDQTVEQALASYGAMAALEGEQNRAA